MAQGDIQTQMLRMRQSVFIKEMLRLYGMPWITAFSVLLVSSVALIIFNDLKWAVVTFMIVCIAAPIIMAFFYIYHGMRPVTVINTLPHTLRFDKDAIIATLFSESKNENTGEPEYSELSRRRLPYSELEKYKTGLTSILLPFRGGEKGFIWLPVSAFENKDGFDMAMNRIISAIRENHKNIYHENPQREQ